MIQVYETKKREKGRRCEKEEAIGMVPKPRLPIYQVCWNGDCFDSDILAAFDPVIVNNINVITISAFRASEGGVLVSTSTGNSSSDNLTVARL